MTEAETPDDTSADTAAAPEAAAEPRPRVTRGSTPIPLPPALQPYKGMVKRVWALVPWLSFGLGVFGAVVMDRGPDQAWLIALAAIGTWIAVLCMRFVGRFERPSLVGAPKLLVGAAKLSFLLATQGLMQLTLFFALPFFFYAAAFDIGHGVFLLLLSLMCIASLWDPLTERLLRRPLLSSAIPAFGSFAALTAVLPALGLSTQVSLWLAVLSAVIGFPIITAASIEPGQRWRWVSLACGLSLLLPVLMYFGATRIVPAAPLRLVHADIGTELSGKWVAQAVRTLDHVPARLHCATAIASPMGLHDQLFHVWKKSGKQRARIALKIVGGRADGYRTHSRITPNEPGKYTCTVETASGQVLGSRSVKITGR